MGTQEFKVALEAAKADFDRFTDCMDLDLETSEMDTEDLAAFTKQKRRILKAMQTGALVINDDGEAVFTPANKKSKTPDPLTFHERTGASLMSTDSKKKNCEVAKMYAMMGDMCGVHPNTFAGLVGNDIKVCEAIFSLLMD